MTKRAKRITETMAQAGLKRRAKRARPEPVNIAALLTRVVVDGNTDVKDFVQAQAIAFDKEVQGTRDLIKGLNIRAVLSEVLEERYQALADERDDRMVRAYALTKELTDAVKATQNQINSLDAVTRDHLQAVALAAGNAEQQREADHEKLLAEFHNQEFRLGQTINGQAADTQAYMYKAVVALRGAILFFGGACGVLAIVVAAVGFLWARAHGVIR